MVAGIVPTVPRGKMSVTFTKLFSSITESTVWCEPSDTRIVWITMLAMADRHGRVFGSVPGLANRSQVSVEATRAALVVFLGPDPDSRTKDHDGRRIAEMDGGWVLLNHGKYRAIRDEDERRAYKAQHERQRRAKVKDEKRGQTHGQSGQERTGVDSGGHNAEAEAYTEQSSKDTSTERAKKPAFSVVAAVGGVLPDGCLPLVDGSGWRPSSEMVAEWQKLYIGVDVRQCLRGMRGWLMADPRRRKTKSGIQRFVVAWLEREQNSFKTGGQDGKRTSNTGGFRSKSESTVDAAREFAEGLADRLGLGQAGHPAASSKDGQG